MWPASSSNSLATVNSLAAIRISAASFQKKRCLLLPRTLAVALYHRHQFGNGDRAGHAPNRRPEKKQISDMAPLHDLTLLT